MEKAKVLFVCVQNSARSQMAEALLNHLDGDRFQAESAGIEPGKLNPLAIAAMKEMNLDISTKGTRDVFDIWRKGGIYNYVITVCDETSGERCPIFPGVTKRLHWSFDDPATFTGTFEQRLVKTIAVREQVKEKIQAWVHELNP
jgi:arsenate reductase (thioredoxin)